MHALLLRFTSCHGGTLPAALTRAGCCPGYRPPGCAAACHLIGSPAALLLPHPPLPPSPTKQTAVHRHTSLHFFSPFAKGSGKRPFTLLAPTDTAWNETFGGCLKACPRAAAVWHVCGARAMAAAGMADGRRPYILWSCLLLGSCVPTASVCKQCLHCLPAAPPALLPAACPSASPHPGTLAAWPEQRPLCSRHSTPCPCPPALLVPNIAGTASEDERGALRQGLAALLLYHQILTAGYSAQQLAERYDAPTALGPSIGKEMKVDVSGIDSFGCFTPWFALAFVRCLLWGCPFRRRRKWM